MPKRRFDLLKFTTAHSLWKRMFLDQQYTTSNDPKGQNSLNDYCDRTDDQVRRFF